MRMFSAVVVPLYRFGCSYLDMGAINDSYDARKIMMLFKLLPSGVNVDWPLDVQVCGCIDDTQDFVKNSMECSSTLAKLQSNFSECCFTCKVKYSHY